MKTNVKKLTTVIGALLLIAVMIQGCSDVAGPDSSNSVVLSENSGSSEIGRLAGDISGGDVTCKTSGTYTFTAGQIYNAGTISYSIIGNKIYVTITTTNGWMMQNSAVYVGDNIEDALNNGGSPSIGNFTAVTDPHDPTVSEFEYSFKLSDVGLDYTETLYILVHATVISDSYGGQTAWGGDKQTGTGWFYHVSEKYEKCSGWGKTQ